MKMNLAVYTATRGYAWQPTSYSEEDIRRFETLIGEFPSVRDENFPFGKIFLDGANIGFCRFHIAKRYDFCGRDAFYCIVGTLSRSDAARIDPIKLFALPVFAAPQNPAPIETEIDAALRTDANENVNILHLLKTCSVSIDGVKGEGALSAVFNLDFISLLERYDYSQKGSMARNELYQKVGESLSAYIDLRRALSQRLVHFPELHKELSLYLKEEETSGLRQSLSQQLLYTSEMRQTILGALDATSTEDSELKRDISSHLIKMPEMQYSVVNYLGEGPSVWRQQVANRLMNSAEMRQVLLAYLEGCSSDWRLTLGRKLLEKPELLNELKQRIVNGNLSIRRELSDILVQTPELLQAFCDYLLQSHGAEIQHVCECISATDEFKIKAFNTILKDSRLRKEFIKKCVNSTEYQEVLDERWDDLNEGLSKNLVLSEKGKCIFYSEIHKSYEFRRKVIQNIYSDLQVIEIEEAIANIRKKKEVAKQVESSKTPWLTQGRLIWISVGVIVLALIVLIKCAIVIWNIIPDNGQMENQPTVDGTMNVSSTFPKPGNGNSHNDNVGNNSKNLSKASNGNNQ